MRIKLTAEMRMRLAYAEELDITDIVAPIIAERDELAAQVSKLQHSVNELCGVIFEYRGLQERSLLTAMFGTAERHKQRLTTTTPQQHLRDVRAEAGRAGFIAGLEYPDKVHFEGATRNPVFAADGYAERIRSGSQP